MFSFVAHDNGGTSSKRTGLAAKYGNKIINEWVSRFDARTTNRIVAINDFLMGNGPLDEFESEGHLKAAMGVQPGSRL